MTTYNLSGQTMEAKGHLYLLKHLQVTDAWARLKQYHNKLADIGQQACMIAAVVIVLVLVSPDTFFSGILSLSESGACLIKLMAVICSIRLLISVLTNEDDDEPELGEKPTHKSIRTKELIEDDHVQSSTAQTYLVALDNDNVCRIFGDTWTDRPSSTTVADISFHDYVFFHDPKEDMRERNSSKLDSSTADSETESAGNCFRNLVTLPKGDDAHKHQGNSLALEEPVDVGKPVDTTTLSRFRRYLGFRPHIKSKDTRKITLSCPLSCCPIDKSSSHKSSTTFNDQEIDLVSVNNIEKAADVESMKMNLTTESLDILQVNHISIRRVKKETVSPNVDENCPYSMSVNIVFDGSLVKEETALDYREICS